MTEEAVSVFLKIYSGTSALLLENMTLKIITEMFSWSVIYNERTIYAWGKEDITLYH